MRTLFLLRGAPASGKSTWVKENNLEPYTLSADGIRLMYQSPVTTITGDIVISQRNENEVWELLFNLLEKRMVNGDFVVVDATHYKSSLLSKYKDLVEKYRYRVYVVDFTSVPLDELLKRNSNRDNYKRVPDEAIKKMITVFENDNEVIGAYKVITKEEATAMINEELKPVDVKEDKVVVFGDIHGCHTALSTYFKENPFDDNTCYIFTGDYLDRGIENKETLEFFLDIYKKSNVVLLEGNHERWLRIYATKEYNLSDYDEDKYGKYVDIYIKRLINEIDNDIAKCEKEKRTRELIIRNLTNELEKERLVDKDAEEVYYEFERVNVPLKVNENTKRIDILACEIDELKKAKNTLVEANINSEKVFNEVVSDVMKKYNLGVHFNLRSMLKKTFNIEVEKQENPIRGLEFLTFTYPQIKDVDKAEIRQLCRKFSQMSYFKLGDKRYLVTHAGVSTMPTIKTASDELIRGVGKYEDSTVIEESFFNKYGDSILQIHAHRNIYDNPMITKTCINLEGKVEHGGYLRIIEISKDGNIVDKSVKNDVFAKESEKIEEKIFSQIELLKEMYHSPLISVKNLNDGIISLNFTRDAFYDRKWNELTCTARGLFVDKKTGDICARSFNKFFNYKEVDWTTAEYLKKNFVYPVVAYKKENGFLGLITKYKGSIKFYTKSSDGGDFVSWFIEVYYNKLHLNSKEELISFLEDKIEEGNTYVFECIDKDRDPHIIKYNENNVYLLEVIENHLDKEVHKPYEELIRIAKNLKVDVKEKAMVFNTWEDFETWKNTFSHGKTQWDCKIEGYVLEDAAGFRVKFKSSFYKFWKYMRAALDQIKSGRPLKKIYKDEMEIKAIKIMEDIGREGLKDKSIIDIEELLVK